MTTRTTTRLERLTMLHDTIMVCKQESVKDADEWKTYDDMMVKVNDMLTEEKRKQGYMAVYPIVDGCSRESLFEGTSEQCDIYVSILKENDPKADIIVLPL